MKNASEFFTQISRKFHANFTPDFTQNFTHIFQPFSSHGAVSYQDSLAFAFFVQESGASSWLCRRTFQSCTVAMPISGFLNDSVGVHSGLLNVFFQKPIFFSRNTSAAPAAVTSPRGGSIWGAFILLGAMLDHASRDC